MLIKFHKEEKNKLLVISKNIKRILSRLKRFSNAKSNLSLSMTCQLILLKNNSILN